MKKSRPPTGNRLRATTTATRCYITLLFTVFCLHWLHWSGIIINHLSNELTTSYMATETELSIYWMINSTKCMLNLTTTLNILGRTLSIL